ncbi:helix-turn-helix transcriptional regulator [Maribacter sp. 2304DJ31-5]|uniref:helix-turn-helix transcriptional regulator n=1 Tax=Maribacter sp. 2304DJ31-5 TaxID=3386273 RepID=UPI0039BD20B0
MDTEAIIKRIERILAHYELSAANFADKIGVQRSGISHLLKRRNKPSLEFVLKTIDGFPEIDLYWLLYGKGEFPSVANHIKKSNTLPNLSGDVKGNLNESTSKDTIERIVIFYRDGSFKSFRDH